MPFRSLIRFVKSSLRFHYKIRKKLIYSFSGDGAHMEHPLASCESQPGFCLCRVSLFFVHFGDYTNDLPVDTSRDIGRVERIGLRCTDEEPDDIRFIRVDRKRRRKIFVLCLLSRGVNDHIMVTDALGFAVLDPLSSKGLSEGCFSALTAADQHHSSHHQVLVTGQTVKPSFVST
jgi:hypothetical protein